MIVSRIILSTFLLFAATSHADLLGLYTFDGGNTLDSSGNGNNGFNETGMGYSAAGFEGMAGQFGGSTFFDVPVDLDAGAAPRATIGAWVNASVIGNPSRHEIISTDNGGFDRALAIDSRNTTGAEGGAANYSAFNGNAALLNGSAASTADGFVFVAAVYNQFSNTTRLHVGNQVFTEPGAMSPSQVFTRVGAHPNGSEGFNGLIDNAFMFDRALSGGEIDRIRLNGAAEILTLAIDPEQNGRLWSVDIHAVGGSINANPTPPTKTGVEAYYNEGNIWNAFEVPGHDSSAINPSLNLVDGDGIASSVNFTISGTISGWSTNGGDPLHGDYAFVNAGASDAEVTWELSGLTPGHTYELMLYGGAGRAAPITVDVNGDGSFLDDTLVSAPGSSGVLVEGISPDGSGRIIGNFTHTGAEANWSGFQLRDTTVIPEPSTAALLVLGFCLIVARRFRNC
ncbi:MAG: hypothetical protein ACI9TH_005165 [Kiritimatiellia bacterium]|jgi:hypothetical protein